MEVTELGPQQDDGGDAGLSLLGAEKNDVMMDVDGGSAAAADAPYIAGNAGRKGGQERKEEEVAKTSRLAAADEARIAAAADEDDAVNHGKNPAHSRRKDAAADIAPEDAESQHGSKSRAGKSAAAHGGKVTAMAALSQVLVRTSLESCRTVVLRVRPSDTVDDVLWQIQRKTGLPAHEHRLIYAGKQLDTSARLQDVPVPHDATLQLIGRLRSTLFPDVWLLVAEMEAGLAQLQRLEAVGAGVGEPPPGAGKGEGGGRGGGKGSEGEGGRADGRGDGGEVPMHEQRAEVAEGGRGGGGGGGDACNLVQEAGGKGRRQRLSKYYEDKIHCAMAQLFVRAVDTIRSGHDGWTIKLAEYIEAFRLAGGVRAAVQLLQLKEPHHMRFADQTVASFLDERALITYMHDYACPGKFARPLLDYLGPVLMELHVLLDSCRLRPVLTARCWDALVKLFGKVQLGRFCPQLNRSPDWLVRNLAPFLEKAATDLCISLHQLTLLAAAKSDTLTSPLTSSASSAFKTFASAIVLSLPFCRPAVRQSAFCRPGWLLTVFGSNQHLAPGGDLAWVCEHRQLIDLDVKRRWMGALLPEPAEDHANRCTVIVHRGPSLLHESFDQIFYAPPEALKSGLLVQFVDEDGSGAGVLREWFMLVGCELFSGANALFSACPDDHQRFFPSPSSAINPGHLSYFRFCGRVVALALMHNIHLDVTFALAFYKLLAGREVTWRDCKDMDPELFASCRAIMALPATDVDADVLGLTFVCSVEEGVGVGESRVVELCPGGEFIKVTNSNRHAFIDLLVKRRIVAPMRLQALAFAAGFSELLHCRDLPISLALHTSPLHASSLHASSLHASSLRPPHSIPAGVSIPAAGVTVTPTGLALAPAGVSIPAAGFPMPPNNDESTSPINHQPSLMVPLATAATAATGATAPIAIAALPNILPMATSIAATAGAGVPADPASAASVVAPMMAESPMAAVAPVAPVVVPMVSPAVAVVESGWVMQQALRPLDAGDFEALLYGEERDIDVADWRAHTDYHGYRATDPEIEWFWEVVEEMTKDQRRRLLYFTTAITRLPASGFAGLQSRFHIHLALTDTTHLPTAHTCFHQLVLPPRGARLAAMEYLKKLRQLDAYPKVNEDFYSRTMSGGILTLISSVVMAVLFITELRLFLQPKIVNELSVDLSRGETLKINLDVTFPRLSCAVLSLDAMDISGEQHLDVVHNIYKRRLTPIGLPVEGIDSKLEIGAKQHDVLKKRDKFGNVVPDDQDFCGSCYGAAETEDQCCNNCEEVREAYNKRGWAFNNADAIEQCKREDLIDKIQAQVGEGCNMYGVLEVNKVAGNFHFAPAKVFYTAGISIFDLVMFHDTVFNISHTVNSLSFGAKFPGAVNPLDKAQWVQESESGMYQYFIKVVPTMYTDSHNHTIASNQFSVTEHFRPAPAHDQQSLPGVFFFYDLSPIKVQYSERYTSFLHFLTNVCAIVGGIFTVTGMEVKEGTQEKVEGAKAGLKESIEYAKADVKQTFEKLKHPMNREKNLEARDEAFERKLEATREKLERKEIAHERRQEATEEALHKVHASKAEQAAEKGTAQHGVAPGAAGATAAGAGAAGAAGAGAGAYGASHERERGAGLGTHERGTGTGYGEAGTGREGVVEKAKHAVTGKPSAERHAERGTGYGETGTGYGESGTGYGAPHGERGTGREGVMEKAKHAVTGKPSAERHAERGTGYGETGTGYGETGTGYGATHGERGTGAGYGASQERGTGGEGVMGKVKHAVTGKPSAERGTGYGETGTGYGETGTGYGGIHGERGTGTGYGASQERGTGGEGVMGKVKHAVTGKPSAETGTGYGETGTGYGGTHGERGTGSGMGTGTGYGHGATHERGTGTGAGYGTGTGYGHEGGAGTGYGAEGGTAAGTGGGGGGIMGTIKKAFTGSKGAVAGGAAGVTVETVLYPIDTIKTRLQVASSGGGINFKGLYSGLSGNLIGVLPASAIFIGVYEPVKAFLLNALPENISVAAHLAAGAAGGTAASLVRVPTEVVKQRMQTGQFPTAVNAVKTILSKEGVRGLYAGYGSFLLRDLPFDAIQFAIYEQLKIQLKKTLKRDLKDPEMAVVGAVSGAITGAVTTPLDVIKTRLMTQGTSGQYKGIIDCIQKTAAQDGVGALFKGVGPRVMWIGIGGSIFFGVLEKTKQLMHKAYHTPPPSEAYF
ncbi:unnamed protein product [Closterium sp. Yama58-4]|nr:unnamed protein product [Closterium sp. Yama58-4]